MRYDSAGDTGSFDIQLVRSVSRCAVQGSVLDGCQAAVHDLRPCYAACQRSVPSVATVRLPRRSIHVLIVPFE